MGFFHILTTGDSWFAIEDGNEGKALAFASDIMSRSSHAPPCRLVLSIVAGAACLCNLLTGA